MYRFITGVVALGLAACAAYFSVIGIASLMGANFLQVAVMAGFLEAGKLVCASAAYRFRKVAPTWIRGLFITFTGIMMLITSLGIFGFLSSSYQKAASERDVNQQQVENVESKLQTFKSEVARLKEDRQRLISEQQELQQTRAEQGWLSKRQDQRLSDIPADLSETDSALTASRDSVLSLQSRITNLESSQNEEAKLGPIIFVANTVGLPEDSAALYFIMLLIFVFDPMAVTLVVALSMATDFEETVTEDEEQEENKVLLSDLAEMDEKERKEKLDEIAREAGSKNKQETKSDGEKILDYDPTGKRPDPQEIRETLGKPLPDDEKEIDGNNLTAKEPDPQKIRESLGGTVMNSMAGEKPTPDERIDKIQDIAAGDILQSFDEEDNSRNKASEEQVEEDPFYPEKPPKLEEEDNPPQKEQDFEEWVSGGDENQEPEEKPWKQPFKRPFDR